MPYNEKDIIAIGKHLAYLLRHHPEAAGLALDVHGWVSVEELISAVNNTSPFELDSKKLDYIVFNDSKGRYVFSEDGNLIRACQGHSIPVDVELLEACPPDILWHGSAERFSRNIEKQGLLPMTRLYVHLSKDVPTARMVGGRHGTPVVYEVAAGRMHEDGIPFYISENDVWLVKSVPPGYLSRIS